LYIIKGQTVLYCSKLKLPPYEIVDSRVHWILWTCFQT